MDTGYRDVNTSCVIVESEMSMSFYCSSRIYIRIYISHPREHCAPKFILEWFITLLPPYVDFPYSDMKCVAYCTCYMWLLICKLDRVTRNNKLSLTSNYLSSETFVVSGPKKSLRIIKVAKVGR
jgi:hypothetical protein